MEDEIETIVRDYDLALLPTAWTVKIVNSDKHLCAFLADRYLQDGQYEYQSLKEIKDSLSSTISARTIDSAVPKFVDLGILQKGKRSSSQPLLLDPNNPFFRLLVQLFLPELPLKAFLQKKKKQRHHQEEADGGAEESLAALERALNNYLSLLTDPRSEDLDLCDPLLKEFAAIKDEVVDSEDVLEDVLEKRIKEVTIDVLTRFENDSLEELFEAIARAFSQNQEEGN